MAIPSLPAPVYPAGSAVPRLLFWVDPVYQATVAWGQRYGVPVQVTSLTRSWEQQACLYSGYLSAKAAGKQAPYAVNCGGQVIHVTAVNAPGDSAHQFGMAWDSYVPPEWQDDWNKVRRAFGWRVPANDQVHAEVPDWRNYVGWTYYEFPTSQVAYAAGQGQWALGHAQDTEGDYGIDDTSLGALYA